MAERIRCWPRKRSGIGVAPATQEVTLRFRGLEFARWRLAAMWYGLGDHQDILTPENGPLSKRWSESWKRIAILGSGHQTSFLPRAARTLAGDHGGRRPFGGSKPASIPGRFIAQVPAFSTGDRGIIDLLGVTRDGRLAVLELKASEDIICVMQAVDYWLRVRWHHDQDDFRRYGYFPEIAVEWQKPRSCFWWHPDSGFIPRRISSCDSYPRK